MTKCIITVESSTGEILCESRELDESFVATILKNFSNCSSLELPVIEDGLIKKKIIGKTLLNNCILTVTTVNTESDEN